MTNEHREERAREICEIVGDLTKLIFDSGIESGRYANKRKSYLKIPISVE